VAKEWAISRMTPRREEPTAVTPAAAEPIAAKEAASWGFDR